MSVMKIFCQIQETQLKTVKLLEQLSNLHGAPGHEDDVTNFAQKALIKLLTERDCLNNLFIRRKNAKADRPKVVLDCHSDEVGFIVEAVNQNGTISFLPLGGWHAANIPAHAVIIKNFKGQYIKGVVASKPPHFMTAEEKVRLPEIGELVIDIGSGSYEETVNDYSIETGNPITPDVEFHFNANSGIMRGKAFDNRLGCTAVITLMNDLHNANLEVEPVGAICAQEEVGLRGAAVAANSVKPDFALIFEGCPADDTFRSPEKARGVIGKGVQFRVVDAGMVSNHRVQSFAKMVAEKHGIPYQVIARSSGQTNGARYYLAQQGIPALVIGIPARYIHTHYSLAQKIDLENAIKLGKKILEELNAETIKGF